MIIYHHLPQGTSAPQGTTTGPREKRFLASLIPTNQDQEAPLWTWIKNLFSGAAAELQETSQLLTPLENDVWTATTILEVISKTRTKRETSESPSAVSKLMKWLQLAVLGPRTLLTPLDDKEFLQNLNRTTESPRNTTPSPANSTRTRRTPDDLHGSMGLLVVIMTEFLQVYEKTKIKERAQGNPISKIKNRFKTLRSSSFSELRKLRLLFRQTFELQLKQVQVLIKRIGNSPLMEA